MSTRPDGETAAFRKAFEEAPIGMALVSVRGAERGRFLRVNAAMCALTGYSESELLDVAFQRITHPDDVSSDLAMMDRLLSGEVSRYELEKRYTHAEGTRSGSS
jgi:PAS domain S-box-containing protein